MHKMAYGTDKHEDFFREASEKAASGSLTETDLAHVKEELDTMQARGTLPAKLSRLRDDLAALNVGRPSVASGRE